MKAVAGFDVVVMGGGLVGAATALALCGGGLRLALVETGVSPDRQPPAGWDSRIYAISPGNATFLRRLGVWDALDQDRIAPIETMHVWGDDLDARLDFSAYEAGVPALGYIVESRLMQAGLWAQLQQQPDVELLYGAQCKKLSWESDAATLELVDRCLEAHLVVGADGGSSWTRAQAGLGASGMDYNQMGVVANFDTELPHQGSARQWFREEGILAWLPLPGRRISMVWSTRTEHAETLLALPQQVLQEQVAAAGNHTLGALRLITPAAGFPLRMQNAAALVRPRLALVGDAAHRVHPLAGQGVNLGFRDAARLAEVVHGRGAQSDPGDYSLLRRYERGRKADIVTMQALTGGLNALFASELPGLTALRNMGLSFTNRQDWLKKCLIARAMA